MKPGDLLDRQFREDLVLAGLIDHYHAHPEERDRMAARAAAKGNPDAAGVIVDDIYTLLANHKA